MRDHCPRSPRQSSDRHNHGEPDLAAFHFHARVTHGGCVASRRGWCRCRPHNLWGWHNLWCWCWRLCWRIDRSVRASLPVDFLRRLKFVGFPRSAVAHAAAFVRVVRATDCSGFPRADSAVAGSCPSCPGVGARASPRAKMICAALVSA